MRPRPRCTGRLAGQAMTRFDVYRIVQRRAEAAGVATEIGCHNWRLRDRRVAGAGGAGGPCATATVHMLSAAAFGASQNGTRTRS